MDHHRVLLRFRIGPHTHAKETWKTSVVLIIKSKGAHNTHADKTETEVVRKRVNDVKTSITRRENEVESRSRRQLRVDERNRQGEETTKKDASDAEALDENQEMNGSYLTKKMGDSTKDSRFESSYSS